MQAGPEAIAAGFLVLEERGLDVQPRRRLLSLWGLGDLHAPAALAEARSPGNSAAGDVRTSLRPQAPRAGPAMGGAMPARRSRHPGPPRRRPGPPRRPLPGRPWRWRAGKL